MYVLLSNYVDTQSIEGWQVVISEILYRQLDA